MRYGKLPIPLAAALFAGCLIGVPASAQVTGSGGGGGPAAGAVGGGTGSGTLGGTGTAMGAQAGRGRLTASMPGTNGSTVCGAIPNGAYAAAPPAGAAPATTGDRNPCGTDNPNCPAGSTQCTDKPAASNESTPQH